MKTIPISLLAHKAQSSTTLTDLLLVGPLPDDSYRGFTLLDVPLSYDDGNGSITYQARTGMEMSALSSTSDLGVDNAEANTLAPVAGFQLEGFTEVQIDAGVLDKTPFVVYRVNYADLSMGHEVIAGGTIGEVRTKFGQMAVLELRSLSQQLKQTIGEVDSLTCRAKFGSQPIGTGGGVVEERFPCGYNLASEWVSGTVLAVGTETDRTFADTGLTQADDYFAPGVVEWIAGANAGQKMEVESFAASTVTLQFPTINAITLGDTYRIRRECSKRKDGHNGCQTFWGADWVLHFRGEPWIPVGDTANLNVPGAATSGNGVTGTGEAV